MERTDTLKLQYDLSAVDMAWGVYARFDYFVSGLVLRIIGTFVGILFMFIFSIKKININILDYVLLVFGFSIVLYLCLYPMVKIFMLLYKSQNVKASVLINKKGFIYVFGECKINKSWLEYKSIKIYKNGVSIFFTGLIEPSYNIWLPLKSFDSYSSLLRFSKNLEEMAKIHMIEEQK